MSTQKGPAIWPGLFAFGQRSLRRGAFAYQSNYSYGYRIVIVSKNDEEVFHFAFPALKVPGGVVGRWEKLSDALVGADLQIEFFDRRLEGATPDVELMRDFVSKMTAEPEVRQRVSALAGSVTGLPDELADVEARLLSLENLVAGELGLE